MPDSYLRILFCKASSSFYSESYCSHCSEMSSLYHFPVLHGQCPVPLAHYPNLCLRNRFVISKSDFRNPEKLSRIGIRLGPRPPVRTQLLLRRTPAVLPWSPTGSVQDIGSGSSRRHSQLSRLGPTHCRISTSSKLIAVRTPSGLQLCSAVAWIPNPPCPRSGQAGGVAVNRTID